MPNLVKKHTPVVMRVTVYSGPDIPSAYDPNWQLYTNLTKEQIAWFQAQPEWQNFLNWVALAPSRATINADVSEATITGALNKSVAL